VFYLDTSAAAKLVVSEKGSTALRRWVSVRDDLLFSSDLLRTELLRATRRVAPEQMVQARAVLESLILLTLSTVVCERAALLEPEGLRSLDALHLAAALEVGDDLQGLLTYDLQLAEGAAALGIEVFSPS
jgi:hypothetical protein